MSEVARKERSAQRSREFWRTTWRRFRTYPLGMAGLTMVGLMFLIAFFAPLLANRQPILCRHEGRMYFPGLIDCLHSIPFTNRIIRKAPPFGLAGFDARAAIDPERGDWALWPPVRFGPLETDFSTAPLQPPSPEHWLGTDDTGRDLLARMIYGTRVSMKVGFISMGIAATIGILLGALAGYFGGWVDIAISRLIEIFMCFPTFFLILAVLAWWPPRIENVMLVIGCTQWVSVARYARGEFLRLRHHEYAIAARALGAGPFRIIFRHLMPNSLAPVLVSVTFGIAAAILVESGLSWLGFGVQPPEPSWGNILRAGYDNILSAPYMITPACVAIFLAVLSFNLVGDALRDVTDPRLKQ